MHIFREIDYKFFLAIAGLVGCAYINQNLQTRATLLKKASYIMPFGYISIVLAFISDIVLFDAHFDWLSIFGMALTSCGLLSKFLI
jgi:drug/metabolite transporter (DMT)-like permease